MLKNTWSPFTLIDMNYGAKPVIQVQVGDARLADFLFTGGSFAC